MNGFNASLDISVIVPISDRSSDAAELYRDYKAGLDATRHSYEFIFVLDGPQDRFAASLRGLAGSGDRITMLGLTRRFGESTALMAGFEHAAGEIILTLPAYPQIEGSEIPRLVAALEGNDLVTAHRWPRAGGILDRLRRSVFHGLLRWVTGLRFRDLGCGARAMRRRVLEEIHLYGDQYRFLAVLADRHGFRVKEVDIRQSPRDRFAGSYGPRFYARGFLDIFTIFFLVRFTKKPLRFFGLIGATMLLVGGAVLSWLIFERLFLDEALAERPALLLSSLLVVLGMQLFALGLLGELIIFTHARSIKDYQIERVIQFPRARTPAQ